MTDAVIQDRLPLWKRVFDEDENSILRALSTMAWDLAAYSCLVEMVDQAPEEEHGKPLNGVMLELLVTGFWSKTFIGVRRLVEAKTIHGARGVCSLRGLIQDARSLQPRITREVFVCQIAGLPYNDDLIERKAWEYWRARLAEGQNSGWTPRELQPEPTRERHALFDRLSGTTRGSSNPCDLISPAVFDALERRLDTLAPLLAHINVAVAHAATDYSRQGRELDRWPLDEAKATLKTLTQVAQCVGDWFCFSGVGHILPTPQFDAFAYLDRPWFAGDRAALERVWDAFDEETRQWYDFPLERLFE